MPINKANKLKLKAQTRAAIYAKSIKDMAQGDTSTRYNVVSKIDKTVVARGVTLDHVTKLGASAFMCDFIPT